jgi:hypothetical protein
MALYWPADAQGKPIGSILRPSTWNNPLGIIADQTRSGDFITRPSHIKTPRLLNVVIQFSYEEYETFDYWFENECRRGEYTFLYPKVNRKNGPLTEYGFQADSELDYGNPGGDIVEIKMVWLEK